MPKIEAVEYIHSKESYKAFTSGDYTVKSTVIVTYDKPTLINGYRTKQFQTKKTWEEYLKLLDRLSKV